MINRNFFFLGPIAVGAALSVQAATDATWIGPSPWNMDGSWSYNAPPTTFPNAADAKARFTGNAQGDVDLGQSITIGHLIATDGTYTIGVSANSCTLSTLLTENATIEISGSAALTFDNAASQFFFNSPVVFTNTSGTVFTLSTTDLEIDNGNTPLTISSGEFAFTNGAFVDASSDISVASGGILTFNSDNQSNLTSFSGSGRINLEQSTIFVSGSNSFSFSGSLTSGNMGVLQNVSTMTLLGDNSGFTGAFENGGTITVSSAVNLGSGSVAMSGGTFSTIGSVPFSLSNPFSLMLGGGIFAIGTGAALTLTSPVTETFPGLSLTVEAPGILTLSAANTYTGATNVMGGRLNVTGSITSDTTVRGPGGFSTTTGTFGGTGVVQAITSVGGIVAPGTSTASSGIGTLTATSLTLDSNSTTLIPITPSSASQLSISGTAMLAGQVQVVANSGHYPKSGSFTILTAGSITGAYNPVVTGSPGFRFSLQSGSVILHYEYIGISTMGLTGSTLAYAKYLNRTAPYTASLQALIQLSGSALKNGINSASPSRNALTTFAIENTVFALSEMVSGHLIDQRFNRTHGSATPSVASLFKNAQEGTALTASVSDRYMKSERCNTATFWMGGLGEFAHQKSQDDNPAFNLISEGVIAGLDSFRIQNNIAGVSGGYAHSRLIQDNDSGHAKINTYFANVYDTCYTDEGSYLELAFWGVYNQVRNYRHISFPGFDATARSSFHCWQVVPHLGLGYHHKFCGWELEPFAQFDCAIAWQRSFSENGAGIFSVRQKAQTSEFLRSEGGIRLYQSRECGCWAWMVMEKLSYVNRKTFGTGQVSASIVGSSSFFSVESFRDVQNLGSAGIEFLMRFGNRTPVTLSLSYNGEMGSKYFSHEGLIRLQKDF